MRPWEKRLADLRQLIQQADDNYFEPDLFRVNVNNAIQTARTVTFLIQKHKDTIPDFENWYRLNVLDRIANDAVMTWLKEARNFIEKEGDLEVESIATATTIFSYTEEGPAISLKEEGCLFVGLKKLMRHIRKVFPTGIFRDSAILIERRWVASTLPSFELTDALNYGYRELKRIVDLLALHLGEGNRIESSENSFAQGSIARRRYLKTEDGLTYQVAQSHAKTNQTDIDVAKTRYNLDAVTQAAKKLTQLGSALEAFSRVAADIFDRDQYHITIGLLLDKDGRPFQIIKLNLADRAEKFIFWREVAHDAQTNRNFAGLLFIAEAWIRSVDGFPAKRISDLPITGESLHLVAADKAGYCAVRSIPISIEDGRKHAHVEQATTVETIPNFLVPLRRAWGFQNDRPADFA
jgi:hypothetical protein